MRRAIFLKSLALPTVLLVSLQPACAGTAKAGEAGLPAAQKAQPKTAAAAHPSTEKSHSGPVLAGKIVETMNASGYTYLLLEKNGVRTWSAVPKTTVKVGDEVQVLPGMPMANFTSKSLNRTFDRIMFSDGLAGKK